MAPGQWLLVTVPRHVRRTACSLGFTLQTTCPVPHTLDYRKLHSCESNEIFRIQVSPIILGSSSAQHDTDRVMSQSGGGRGISTDASLPIENKTLESAGQVHIACVVHCVPEQIKIVKGAGSHCVRPCRGVVHSFRNEAQTCPCEPWSFATAALVHSGWAEAKIFLRVQTNRCCVAEYACRPQSRNAVQHVPLQMWTHPSMTRLNFQVSFTKAIVTLSLSRLRGLTGCEPALEDETIEATHGYRPPPSDDQTSSDTSCVHNFVGRIRGTWVPQISDRFVTPHRFCETDSGPPWTTA